MKKSFFGALALVATLIVGSGSANAQTSTLAFSISEKGKFTATSTLSAASTVRCKVDLYSKLSSVAGTPKAKKIASKTLAKGKLW